MKERMLLSIVSTRFDAIYKCLKNEYGGTRLVISPGDTFEARLGSSLLEKILPRKILSFFSQSYRDENQETIKYFSQVFGQRRLTIMSRRAGINLEVKERAGLPLTRREVSRIFIEMGNLHLEDVTELFRYIASDKAPYKGGDLEDEARRHLHDTFKGREIKDLSRDEWSLLHAFLVPVSMDTLFFGRVPSFKGYFFSAGENELRKRVYLAEKVWREGEKIHEASWAGWMTKALDDRQKGSSDSLFPHPTEGVFRLFGQIDTESADLSLYQSLTEGVPSMVKFYGLGLAPNANGWIAFKESLYQKLGLKGMQRVEPALRYLLGRTDVKPTHFDVRYSGCEIEPFVPAGAEGLTSLAQSMGCAVATQVAIANPRFFRKMIFVSSPGLEEKLCRTFATRAEDGAMDILHVIDEGDIITQSGFRLGYACKAADRKRVRLAFISKERKTKEQLKEALLHPAPVPTGFSHRIVAFFRGFTGPHWKDTTLVHEGSYSMASWDNTTQEGEQIIDSALSVRTWEEVRLGMGEAVLS